MFSLESDGFMDSRKKNRRMYIYCSEATVSGERDACHIAVTTRFVHIRLAPLAIIHFLSIFTRMREMIHMVRTVLLCIRFIASSRY